MEMSSLDSVVSASACSLHTFHLILFQLLLVLNSEIHYPLAEKSKLLLIAWHVNVAVARTLSWQTFSGPSCIIMYYALKSRENRAVDVVKVVKQQLLRYWLVVVENDQV